MRNKMRSFLVGLMAWGVAISAVMMFAAAPAARAQSRMSDRGAPPYPVPASMPQTQPMPAQPQVQAALRPMPPDPYAPSTTLTAPPPAPAYASAYSNYYGYPAQEVNAVPPAKARQVIARAQYGEARTSLYRVVDLLHEDFENSEEYLSAVRAEKDAYDAFDAARKRVLRKLSQDSMYQANQQLAADTAQQLENLRSDSRASKSEILALASLKLDYSTRVTERETAALNDDSDVQQARQRLVEAGRRAADLRSKFKRSIKRDDNFVAARDELADNRIAFLGADAFLRSTIDARDIALDYAVWVHRYDPYTGYGFGFSNYYPSPFQAVLRPDARFLFSRHAAILNR